MAGTYPDAPGPRIAYDRDGSAGFSITNTNVISTLTNAQIVTLNDEDSDSVSISGSGGSIGLIFPVAMTITALWHFGPTLRTDVSSDTTNGLDGTWATIRALTGSSATIKPNYRTDVYTLPSASTNVKAVRVFHNNAIAQSLQCLHLYGYPTSTSDRLEFWHPTLDQPLRNTPAYFDFGDIARDAANIERDFRIKNLSASLTANTVTVGCEAPTDATPTYVSQMEFRYNGGTYASTATVGSVAPNTISNVFTAKFDISATAVLGTWTQRYYAQAASWS